MNASSSSVQARLSALRELFYGAPSAALWERLVAQLDAWPEGEGLGVGLAYAAEHLEGWPDALRQCPPHWVRALVVGEGADPGERVSVARELRAVGTTRGGAWALGALSTWAERPALGGLRALVLRRVQVGNNGAAMLARAEALGGVERLELVGAGLSVRGAERLGSGALGAGLVELDLSGNGVGARGLGAVVGRAVGLRGLCARDAALTGDGFEGWPALPDLARLDVSDNRLDPGGLCAGLAALDAPSLEQLVLDGCALQGRDIDALGRGGWPRLEALQARASDLGDRGLRRLLGCGFAGRLVRLDVSASGLTDASVEGLRALLVAGRLARLVAEDNGFSAAGAGRLLEAARGRSGCAVTV